jgi:hypothetical protein
MLGVREADKERNGLRPEPQARSNDLFITKNPHDCLGEPKEHIKRYLGREQGTSEAWDQALRD